MRIRKNHRLLFLAGVFMIWAALACNAPGDKAPPPTVTMLPPVTEASRAQASPTPLPSPTNPGPTHTPVPDVSGPDGCTLNAAYVADVTIPDDTPFDPGETFTKVWRVRNSGTCAWEQGTQLIFLTGDPLGGPTAVDVSEEVAPEANVDVGVDFVAPTAPGTYRSNWRLQAPDGTQFGTQVYVQIIVPEPVTETPTPTEAPDLPDLVITNLAVDTDDPRQGTPLHIVATLHNRGTKKADDFYWAWRVCVADDCEYTRAPGSFTLDPGETITAQMEYLFAGWATYTTDAWIDSDEEVDESDETNNLYQLVIPVKAKGLPDLVVSAITFTPDPPVQGQNTTVQVSVQNQGTSITDSFDVEWWGGVNFGEPSCEWTVTDGLEQDETSNMICTFAYTSWYGNITSRAIADVGEVITEEDETNNSLDKDTPVNQP